MPKVLRRGPEWIFHRFCHLFGVLGGPVGSFGRPLEASGSLWVPKWRSGVTKEGTEDLQERFCGYLKNPCFYKGKHGFWRSGRHPEASGKHPGGIWMLPGSIWMLLEGSRRSRRLLGGMGAPLRDPAPEGTHLGGGNVLIPWG